MRLLIYELHCVKTVSELHFFAPLELLFERKQVPQTIVNVRIRRKTMEPLEPVPVPWAQIAGNISTWVFCSASP